jgi:S-formylglutathione hydrolase FrmB
LEQSERFQEIARALGCTVEVRVHHGGKHGWLTMSRDVQQFAEWADRYLRAEKK